MVVSGLKITGERGVVETWGVYRLNGVFHVFRGNLFENEVLEKPLPLGPSVINLGERRRYFKVRLVSGRSPST